MIIQLPRDITTIVLRFDGSDFDRSDPGHTITLLSGREPMRQREPVPEIETTRATGTSLLRKLRLPALGARRRTMFACGIAGMLVTGLGVSILQAPRAEPTLFQPRATAWNDSAPGMQPQSQSQQPSQQQQMPEQMRAELDRSPVVVPPDAGPMPTQASSQSRPAGNPFGLE